MKKKMANERFRIILIPIIAVILIVAIVLPIAASSYSGQLDMTLGRGQRHVVMLDGISKESVEYYKPDFVEPNAGTLQNADPPTAIEEQSRSAKAAVALKVANEGVTLLKNNGALPLAKNSKVTPFGYRYIKPIWGGTGASATNMNFDYVTTAEEALAANFTVNGSVVDKMKAASPVIMTATVPEGSTAKFSASGDDLSTDNTLKEYDPTIYAGTESSCAGTTGIVFIGRLGIEGDDLYTLPYDDGGAQHELQLTTYEKNTIAFAKANCDKVVIVCNFSNVVEIRELEKDADIDAILWIGNPGAKGLEAMGGVLVGDVNPSGRTVDTWVSEYSKDPTFVNVLNGTYTNTVSKNYYEYEEGIYIGYRYYETAAKEAANGNYAGFDYDAQVVYPFGYGLHYENDKITQTLDSATLSRGNLKVEGTIKNASGRDVMETVQIYIEAPYDRTGSKIERSAKELVDFGKYSVKAGQSTKFSFTIPQENFAAYDDKCYYSEKGSYVLEKGSYVVHLGKNSHEDWGSKTVELGNTIAYTDGTVKNGARAEGKRDSDGIVVENQFPEINKYIADGYMTVMSRSNFAGTWPTAPGKDRTAPDYVVAANANFDSKNDAICGVENTNALLYKSEKPTSKAKNNVILSSLRGLDYDDPMWDELLDQIDYEDETTVSAFITYGLYMTQPYEALGIVGTSNNDGPLGLTATWSGTVGHVVAVAWTCAPITAATFNPELIHEMGEAIGQEGLTNNIAGWYAPAVNLHRSQFGGRNFEYYSEDALLSGKIGAAMISGARQNGLFTTLKHFALNEMDHSRGSSQVYATEQAMREMLLRSFEIATKEAVCTEKVYDPQTGGQKEVTIKACGAYMTSMMFVGPKFSGNSYALLTTVLRNEWGFEGFVITDFTSGNNKNRDCGYRVGNDLWMGMRTTMLADLTTATAQWAARNAIHNIAYTVVNSAAYNYVAPGAYAYYDMSPWMIALIVFECVAGVLVIAGVVWIVLRTLDEKKNPDKYASGDRNA